MKIRRGKAEDLVSLVKLFEEFWRTNYDGVPFSAVCASGLVHKMLNGHDTIVVVAEEEGDLVGYSLAAVVPLLFNTDVTSVSELVVYAREPKVRKLLDNKTRQVGKQLGATVVCKAELQLEEVA